MSDSLSDQSIKLVEARTDLGLSDLSGTEELTTKIEAVDDPGKCITHSLFLIYYKPTNHHFYTTKVQLPKYRYRVLESTRYNY